MKIRPFIGIWVHQNPELGNVVYVMPGFLSVVGCQIIPPEVGPLGLEEGPILWTPVFEIISNYEGSVAFFLHGREGGVDYIHPGFLKSVDQNCNMLLLEVKSQHKRNGGKLAYSRSFAYEIEKEASRRLSRPDSRISTSQREVGQKRSTMPFSFLGFGDRRRLLDVVTAQVRLNVPDMANELLFPCSRNNEADLKRDAAVLYERRLLLLQMYKHGDGNHAHLSGSQAPLNPTELGSTDIWKCLECTSGCQQAKDRAQAHCTKGKSLARLLRNGFKQILGTSSTTNGIHEFQKKVTSSSGGKHVQLHEFLQSRDTIGLCLRAATTRLSTYRVWPNMHDNRYTLYKLPVPVPRAGHEYAGLWGGTFGWPPGKLSEDKPGKALFFILISYEQSEGQQLLIGTKILEGKSYVLHPNGSAMFIVNIDKPCIDTFPWDTDENSCYVHVKQSFMGEGIANGYGFRYPGSKPGSLFVIQNGTLVFIWKESGAVLTLRRLNLADLLRKGERMPSLLPVSNFAYLTKTFSNVFSGFSNSSSGLSS